MIFIIAENWRSASAYLQDRGVPSSPMKISCFRPGELRPRLEGIEFQTIISLCPLSPEEKQFITSRRCLWVEV